MHIVTLNNVQLPLFSITALVCDLHDIINPVLVMFLHTPFLFQLVVITLGLIGKLIVLSYGNVLL